MITKLEKEIMESKKELVDEIKVAIENVTTKQFQVHVIKKILEENYGKHTKILYGFRSMDDLDNQNVAVLTFILNKLNLIHQQNLKAAMQVTTRRPTVEEEDAGGLFPGGAA